jgi:hypothetical protein
LEITVDIQAILWLPSGRRHFRDSVLDLAGFEEGSEIDQIKRVVTVMKAISLDSLNDGRLRLELKIF